MWFFMCCLVSFKPNKAAALSSPSTAARTAVRPLRSCSIMALSTSLLTRSPFLVIHSLFPMRTEYFWEVTVAAGRKHNATIMWITRELPCSSSQPGSTTALQGTQTGIKNSSILSALPISSCVLNKRDTNISSVLGSHPCQRATNHRSKGSKGPSHLLSASDFYEQPNGVERPNKELFLSENSSVMQIHIILGSKW